MRTGDAHYALLGHKLDLALNLDGSELRSYAIRAAHTSGILAVANVIAK